MATTMAAVRLFTALLKDATLGPRIVPIVADEARTFGMAGLFRQIGIYSPQGQLYDPEDAQSLTPYREKRDGQLLEEGITEAGAISSWIAAATAYSVHDLPLLPFYIFYSMFGFQRVGDLIWAAADQRARGFLIGATAGRTTLGGEGLQHQDGTSHVIAATIPNCRAYDPAFAYEVAVILDHGTREMLEEQRDVFYYLTVMNEAYAQPNISDDAHVRDDIVRGMYRFGRYGVNGASDARGVSDGSDASKGSVAARARVHLLGSGAILPEVIAAAELLAADWNIGADVWSVTSFSELAREARECERHNRLHPGSPRKSYVARCLTGAEAGIGAGTESATGTAPDANRESIALPVVAATDYVVAYPQLIAAYVPARFIALGTDGFGRSDTRAALRSFFEVDRHQIVLAALQAAAPELAPEALKRYAIVVNDSPPWER